MQRTNFNNSYILAIALVAAMGGLLFGYDWVVIGGAKPFYERFFRISDSPNLQGLAMSSALVGCLFGALFSGYLSDSFGRKKPLIGAALLFTISAIGTGIINEFGPFVVYRLIGGIGIGLASTISPVYIAEISPAERRGRLVSVNQLAIVTGIVAAQLINYLIAEPVPDGMTDSQIIQSWNGQTGWRWMFWAETFPASLFLVLAFLIPESPRYLIRTGNEKLALSTLSRIGGNAYASSEMDFISETMSTRDQEVHKGELLSRKVRPKLILGIILAVFQQWCGINVIFNYAEEIFTSAGYGTGDILFNIVLTGTVNLIFTLIAILTVDKWGRKKLMLTGALGLAVIYLFLGSFYYYKFEGFAVLLMVIIAISVYAMTLAPVTWVILSEIFPNRVRGAAMAAGTTALWIACFALTYTFPVLNKLLETRGTFWLYALICASGFFFILKKLPETKGKSLEEIENLLI